MPTLEVVRENYTDALLISFADMIKKHCHKSFRFGGDEFVIVSLDKDEVTIHQRLESINEAFKHQTEIVTLSYGMTRITQDQKLDSDDNVIYEKEVQARNRYEAVGKANAALQAYAYQAKKKGPDDL